MDDAAADVPKRLFIPRFPLLLLDGYVASSVVHSSLRELVYRRSYRIYVISYVRIYPFFPFSKRTRIDIYSNGTNDGIAANRLEIQQRSIASCMISQVIGYRLHRNRVRRIVLVEWLYELIDNY